MADFGDTDLPTLIRRKDHLNILRYIRVHKIRDANLVLRHGKALLREDLSAKSIAGGEVARLAALEQICLAALDKLDHETADVCLSQLRDSGVAKGSARFRLLLGRCLEGANDAAGAENIYQELLSENPSNLMAIKRLYCLAKSQVGKESQAVEALNSYLKQNYSDTAAWYEMAQLRREMGDFKSAAYCLEEVVLGAPADAKLHCELAECYATIGGIENLGYARKHMAQSLELDPTSRRAQMGIVSIANSYLEEAQKASKKQGVDEFEVSVAKELVKYGSEQVLKSYKGTELFPAVKTLMGEYTEDL